MLNPLKRFLTRPATEPTRPQLDGFKKQALEVGRNRLIVTGSVFLIAFLAIGGRLVDLTVIKGPQQTARAPAGETRTVGVRGDVVDRNGILLATSLPTASLYAKPKEIRNAAEAADKVARALPYLSRGDLESRLASSRNFVYLARNLTPKQQYEINRLGVPGLYFETGDKRIYPQGALAAHVVGLTDVDGKGIAGVEKTHDGELIAAKAPLELSIDIRVQTVLRAELARAVSEFRAIGATGVVTDVETGEILGMVSLPDFDPNSPATTTSESMFNRATLGVYEMGSTFKLFNTALALDSGKMRLETAYDVSKPIQISRFTINDYHPIRRPLSVAEILVESSNIGSAKMAVDLGVDAQKSFLGKLGLLRQPEIELPEVGAPLYPATWREINAMTISYGHGISVTPLHLANATAALVNGGVFRQATLLKRPDGADAPGQQVISAKTSMAMRQLMRAVVERGTGTKAEAAGYLVGGKTGTSEKIGARGGYQKKALLSSFVGAFPMTKPKYVVSINVDEPKATKETFGYATGGWVAAPVVSRVVTQIGPLLGIAPIDAEAPEVRKAMQVPGLQEKKVASN